MWHIAKVEDGWINSYARQTQTVWERDGWAARLGLPEEGSGFGYDMDEIRVLPEFDLDVLNEYAQAVREATLAYIEQSTPEEIGKQRGRGWRQPYCAGSALSHLLVEESQHVGQIAYIRGMLRGTDS